MMSGDTGSSSERLPPTEFTLNEVGRMVYDMTIRLANDKKKIQANQFAHESFERQQTSLNKSVEDQMTRLQVAVEDLGKKPPEGTMRVTASRPRGWPLPRSVLVKPVGFDADAWPKLKIKPPRFSVKEGTTGCQKKDTRGYELDGAQHSVIKDNVLEGDTTRPLVKTRVVNAYRPSSLSDAIALAQQLSTCRTAATQLVQTRSQPQWQRRDQRSPAPATTNGPKLLGGPKPVTPQPRQQRKGAPARLPDHPHICGRESREDGSRPLLVLPEEVHSGPCLGEEILHPLG
ncbi:hypothetical protein SASPL_137911 [Salvia splendens]|uniref:Uncharacterized protein n=1 Tax=Salvia splendens TaxID=180675 RepID=A0A8X8ZDM2_SALSN|nr:hypothetical protein SASPL_137911 [Salvia splendens]